MEKYKDLDDIAKEINDIIYHGDCSYIMSVKWDDFIENPQTYIEKAYLLQNSIEQYEISEEIG